MAANYSPKIVDGNMIVYYDAGNLKSYRVGTSCYDLSNSGNNGAFGGGVSSSQANGGSFAFNGVSNTAYIDVNSSANALSTTTYTKMAFIYPTSLATSNNIISGGSSGQHAFWLAGGNTFQAGHNGNWSTVVSTSIVSVNSWFFGAVSFSSTTGWRMYFNGVQQATSASTTTFTGTGFIRLGSYDIGNNFTGNIACPLIYNRVLSADEVLQNFNALRGRFGL